MTIIEWALAGSAAATLLLGFHLRRLARSLGPVPGRGDVDDAELPSLSVVAAARNEQRHLEAAVRSWLALRVPRLEVIVVDDRSTDRTPVILAELAARSPELQVLRLDSRPEDWLGKCRALHEGALRASGEYLLFTDADVLLDPSAIRRVLAHARRERLDHLALLPRVHVVNALQAGLTWLFFQLFLAALAGPATGRAARRGAVGVGAFGLVRRSAYEAVGGHEDIRMQVGDDVALARLLVRAGFRQAVHWGLDVAELEWQRGAWGTVRGLEKNAFWALRFSTPLLVAGSALALLQLAPLAAPWVGTPAAWAAFAAWWAGVAAAADVREAPAGQRLAAVLLHPVSSVLLLVAAWNSAAHYWRRGGIAWRDDFQPAPRLRSSLKPLSWWIGPPEETRPAGARIDAGDPPR